MTRTPSPASARPKRQLPSGESPRSGRAVYLFFVWIAGALGTAITAITVGSFVGRVSPSLVLHAAVGLAVAVGLPFLLLDRLLRRLDVPKRGVTAEVYTFFSMAIGVMALALGASFTRTSLQLEGEKLYDRGYIAAARPFFFLAGAKLVEVPPIEPEPIVPLLDEVKDACPDVAPIDASPPVDATEAADVAVDTPAVSDAAVDSGKPAKKPTPPARPGKKPLDEAVKLAQGSFGRLIVRSGVQTRIASAVLVDSSGLWIAADIGFAKADQVQLEVRGELVREVAWLGTLDSEGLALVRADASGASALKLSPEAVAKGGTAAAYVVATAAKIPLWFDVAVQLVDDHLAAKVDESMASLLSSGGGFIVDGRSELVGVVAKKDRQGDFVEVVNLVDVRELLTRTEVKRQWGP